MKTKGFKIFLYVLAFIGLWEIVIQASEKIHHDVPLKYNPRHAVNGIDTVYTDDSVYTIQVKVQAVTDKDEDTRANRMDYQ